MARQGGGLYIDGADALSLTAATLQDLRIAGTVGGRGAGVTVRATPVVDVTGTVFDGNEAPGDGDGAGLDISGATTCGVTGSWFFDNDAGRDGGGLRVHADAECDLTLNTFAGNLATRGADLVVDDAIVQDEDGLYELGVATAGGGSVHVTGADAELTLRGTVIRGASAPDGGAVQVAGGMVTLLGAGLQGNSATLGGQIHVGGDAGLHLQPDPVYGSTVLAFGDADQGGAIWYGGSRPLTLDRALIVGHDASGHGGALHVSSSASVLIDRAALIDNTAGTHGGAVSWASGAGDGELTVRASSFVDNQADADATGNGDGGALYADGAGDLVLEDNHLTSNGAVSGGGLYLREVRSLVASRNDVCGNAASGPGGGAYVETIANTPRDLRSNVFVDNTAAGAGGALFVGSTTGDLINNHFVGSASSSGGGAVHLDDAAMVFVNNLVAHSTGKGLMTVDGVPGRREYNAWYANAGAHLDLDGTVDDPDDLDATGGLRVVDEDPLFTSYTPGGPCAAQKLWPAAGSPLIDQGDPAIDDAVDDSRSDIGAYGGTAQDEGLFLDGDGDGQSPADGDCDDDDPLVYAGAAEVPGDGIDSNCDGFEDCFEDGDGDGFGSQVVLPSTDLTCLTGGVSPVSTDCDDDDDQVRPGALEIVADGKDDNCDGTEICYVDDDGDGHGTPSTVATSDLTCTGAGVSLWSDDCDDTDDGVHPGADEIPGDGVDQDCDGKDTCYVDGDGDGYGSAATVVSANLTCNGAGMSALGGDCDDADDTVRPGATELPADGVDQDCDAQELCYVDGDGDGYGTAATALSGSLDCDDDGVSDRSDDCDDADDAVHPGAAELPADGVDQDCDEQELCYVDEDGDGHGGPNTGLSDSPTCDEAGFAGAHDDCDDDDEDVHPGATEQPADDVDQDCDGRELCFVDADGDGYGSAATVLSVDLQCLTARNESVFGTDCDDADPATHPGADEVVGDGKDQDCNELETCWLDLDGDGYAGELATGETASLSCAPNGFFSVAEDCNDSAANIHPGATEIPADGLDQDCDGRERCYVDADGDGFGTTDTVLSIDMACLTARGESGLSTDCDDADADAWPGAPEVVADGKDQSCDGRELCYLDADDDGFGSATTELSAVGDLACAGTHRAANADDCNDALASVYPGAVEVIANNRDDDCDGFEICYEDLDGDTHGTEVTVQSAVVTCTAPGTSKTASDCDDDDATIYLGAPEIPNDGIDQDCDGNDLVGCYEDLDLDGFGSHVVILAPDGDCDDPGESYVQSDCDDGDDSVYPGAEEICGDGIDQDCDGRGGPDDDDDDDGLDWLTEQALGLDDCDPDFDGDGVQDGHEVALGLDPAHVDSDGDGAPDGWEIGASPLTPRDTDEDGIIDALDPDDDGDGVPTVDEDRDGNGDPRDDDSDDDGIPDFLDPDDDGDGLTTLWEGTGDFDGDGIPNYLDLDDDGDGAPTAYELSVGADPYGLDSDFDTIPDAIEHPRGDSDGDGIPDIVDPDDDGDGIPTILEGAWDADGDGIPNYLDLDSDGDGKPDAVEGQEDDDGDTIPNFLDPDDTDGLDGDADGDGLSSGVELQIGTLVASPDSDGDGVDDGTEHGGGATPRDTDNDGLIDALDPDDDGDGVPTELETGLERYCPDGSYPQLRHAGIPATMRLVCADGTVDTGPWTLRDTDGDGVPDYLDDDDDGDGVPTALEDRNGNGDWTDDDTDGDGIPDYLDANDHDGATGDADGDGLTNEVEVALGTDPLRADTDGDGIPDGDEVGDPADPRDTDGDGVIDALDPDDDGDGIPTAVEGRVDTDGDGVPNHLDLDSDDDGRPDAVEGLGDDDCDGIPNYVDPVDDLGLCAASGEPPEPRRIAFVEGCACDGSGGGGAGWLALGLVGLVIRRRRR